MKRSFCFALVLTLLLSAGQLYADTIGYLDMERLFKSYKEAQKIQKELQDKRETYQKLLEDKQEQITDARRKKKSEKELEKMLERIEKELEPEQKKLIQYEAQAQQNLLSTILAAARVTAKEYGVDVILDKRVVYVGGFDITRLVVDRLNSQSR